MLAGDTANDIARKIRFGSAAADYAVFNTLTQKYESAKSGSPWHGKVVGGYAIQGKFSQNPSADMPVEGGAQPVGFTTTKTVKQPEIATATGNLLNAQQQQQTQTATNFKDFLNQAREINTQSRDQLAKDQAAFDTSKIETQLPANDLAYSTRQNEITSNIAGRNKDFAAQTNDVLARLTAGNAAYETAAQGVADRAYGAATKRNSLYQLASGTPTSGSGAMTNRAIKAYQDVNVPLQRELADRRYSQIANIERPYQNQLYGNDMTLMNRESALASDYAGRADNTAKFLQNLRMQVAGMSRAQAQDYLLKLGMPLEIGQRIIAGDISNLAGIQRLDEMANYYTVQTPFDESRLPAVNSYPVSYPSRSYTPDSTPQLPTTSNPVVAGSYGGVNQDGTPRTNPLGQDYSSWYTPQLLAMRQAAAARAAIPRPITASPIGDYGGILSRDGYNWRSGSSLIDDPAYSYANSA